jgi:hypothetical protein
LLACGVVEDGRSRGSSHLAGDEAATGGTITGGAAGVTAASGGTFTGGAAGVTAASGGSTANGSGGRSNVTAPPLIDGGRAVNHDGGAPLDAGRTGNSDSGWDGRARSDAVPPAPVSGLSLASFDRPLSGITAADWSKTQQRFFLLESSTNRFWRVDPATEPAAVTGPYPIPAGTVAPRAFAVSDDRVFTIVDGSIRRLSMDGVESEPPVPLSGAPSSSGLTAAYAGGTLLVGDVGGPAQALADGENATRLHGTRSVSDAGAEGGVNVSYSGLWGLPEIAENGTHFAVPVVHFPYMQSHLVPADALELNPSPCDLGSNLDRLSQFGVFESTIAWVQRLPMNLPEGSGRLHFRRIVDGSCTDLGWVPFGQLPGDAVGLIDDNLAIILEHTSGYRFDLAIIDRRTGAKVGSPVSVVDVLPGYPLRLVMGPRRAVVVARDRSALVAF